MRKYLIYILLLLPWAAFAQTPVTLAECLALGEENTPALRNAQLDIQSAKALKSELVWSYFPNVSVRSFGFWSRDPLLDVGLSDIIGDSRAALIINDGAEYIAGKLEIPTRVQAFHYGWGVAASAIQPVFAGGRIINGNKLASVGVKAAEVQYDMQLRDKRREIEEGYWQVVSLQDKSRTLAAVQATVDSLCQTVAAARKAGLVPESDLTAVQLQQKRLSAAAVTLRGGIRLAKINLFNTIGKSYAYLDLDQYVFADAVEPLPRPLEPAGDAASPESALLSMQVEAKRLEKQVQIGEFLPQVGIGAGYGYSQFQGPRDPGTSLLAFATVKIPLTGIGQAVSRARRYDAALQKARNDQAYNEAQLALLERKLHLEMETAWEQAQILREAWQVAEDGSRRSRADWKAGRISLADYLRTTVDARQAHEAYLDQCLVYRRAYSAYAARYAAPR